MTSSRRPAAGDDPTSIRGDVTPYIAGLSLAARVIVRCLARVRLEGALDSIPRTGPLILAPNHLSNADGPIITGWLTPALGRRIHWLGKREMFKVPGSGLVLGSASVHPVDRGAADIEAYRLAERILAAGNVLLAFPEGTRSRTGSLQRPREGIGLLALRTDAPVLPVGISGTERLWPPGDRPHPGARVTIRVGPAFRVREVLEEAATDRRRAKSLATDAVMERIATLLPERQRGPYAPASDEHRDPSAPAT
jgi:1-acyl-sn-glycerol-3-phosphate acyltransferase